MALEKDYQERLIKKIKNMLNNDCIVLKNESFNHQGLPDLTILYRNRWAMLEVKASTESSHRPNQEWWINHINNTGAFAAFVYPENESYVLDILYKYLNG